MRSKFLLALAVFQAALPIPALAYDKSIYPTTEEVYSDCKESISLVNQGNLNVFLRSGCASRIQGIIAGFRIGTQAMDISDPADPEGVYIRKLIEKQASRICVAPIESNNDSQPLELLLAKEYVSFIDNYKGDIPLETYMHQRGTFQITDLLQSKCKH